MEDIHGQKYTQEYLDSHLNKEEHTQTKKGKKKLRPWRIPPSRPPLPEQRASVSRNHQVVVALSASSLRTSNGTIFILFQVS